MVEFLLIGLFLLSWFIPISFIVGIYEGFGRSKYICHKDVKTNLLKTNLMLIREGKIIQGISYGNNACFYYDKPSILNIFKRVYSFSLKWSVYYSYKWFNLV